ncbi:MAG: gamma-glutamyltransferase [Alphaproteobacteria bacterium]
MDSRPSPPPRRPNLSRPLIIGRRGAVASQHPLATQAGLAALQAGGNAVDAAVAVGLALGVVEPHLSGLGGDGFYHVLDARSGASTVFNGAGAAPAAATAERYLAKGPRMPWRGPLSISVPGALGGLAAMHARFGSKPWRGLVQPAIELAHEGFGATHHYRVFAAVGRPRLRADPQSAAVYLADGEVPPLGAMVRQPALAATLGTIAAEGADTFFRGPLARRLADGIARAGGLLSADDLAACRPEQQAPIVATYRGFEMRQTPPNSMGFAVLQMLRILERFDVAAAGWGSAELIHLTIEARKRAFGDRDRVAGDPRHAAVPVAALLDPAAIAAHVRAIDRDRAAPAAAAPAAVPGDTSYFAVVDGAGNAVSAIQSLSDAFGSGITAGDTGVLMNNRMVHWHLAEGHPNRLAPGKRVRQTMCAPIVLRDGGLFCVLGTPGGDNQALCQVEALVAMIDFGLDPQRAIDAPRWIGPSGAEQPEHIGLERPVPTAVVDELRRRGHEVRILPERGAVVCLSVIQRDPASGVLMAASDPRLDGWAAAY